MLSYSRFILPAQILWLAFSPYAISTPQQPTSRPESERIMLTVTVKNRAGEYVMGLKRDAFDLTDEKDVRHVEFFEDADNPVSIGILIDTSESMEFLELKEFARAQAIAEAVSGLFELGHANNEYFLMAFDRKPRILSDWTSGQALLAQKTQLKQEKGNTAMYDACLAALDKLKTGRHSKKVIILVSDGLDNISRHTLKEVRDSLRDSDIILYGILVRNVTDLSSNHVEGEQVLTELADVTGGEILIARNKNQLDRAVEVIATQLHHQYQIGFQSADGPTKKWHRIKLKVTLPPNASQEFSKLTVRTRQGYYTR